MADPVEIAFASPSGAEVRLEWSADDLARLGAERPRPWRLASEVSWSEVEAIRLLSARFADRAIAIAALRPVGAAHGDESVAGLLFAGGESERLGEALLSVERGGDGAVRRVGLELYRADGELPIRVAGDASDCRESAEDGLRVERTSLEVRAQGERGFGIYEVLRRA